MLHCPDDDDDDHDVDDDEDHDGVRHSGGSAAVDPTYERPEVVAPALRAAQLYWVRGPMGGVVRRRGQSAGRTSRTAVHRCDVQRSHDGKSLPPARSAPWHV
jgi:hypothetical protein